MTSRSLSLVLVLLASACDHSGDTFRAVQAQPAEHAITEREWSSRLDGDLRKVLDDGDRKIAAQGSKARIIWGSVYGDEYLVQGDEKTVHIRYVIESKGECFTGELEMIRRALPGGGFGEPELRGASPVDLGGAPTGTFIHCEVAKDARGGVHRQ